MRGRWMIAVLGVSLVAGWGVAEARGRGRGGRSGEDRSQRKAQMLERFDADGDGQLSDAERQTAREEHEARRQARDDSRPAAAGSSFGQEDTGRGPAKMSEEGRQKMLERFDTDGDGVLSDSEREAAREARRAEREAHHQAMLAKYDADGDGALSEEERQAASEAEGIPMLGRGGPRDGRGPEEGGGRMGSGTFEQMGNDPEVSQAFQAYHQASVAFREAVDSGDRSAIETAREELDAARTAVDTVRARYFQNQD